VYASVGHVARGYKIYTLSHFTTLRDFIGRLFCEIVEEQYMRQQDEEIPPSDYTALFDHYGSVILAYLRLHTRSPEDAEDLTLEVFAAALEHRELVTWSGSRQLSWLKRVAHHKLIDSYRRDGRHATVTLGQLEETLFDERDPEKVVLYKEAHGQLHQYIQQLSPFQQQLLLLRYGYGLPTAEIAVLLNRSDQAIRKMLSRTISLLRAMSTPLPVKKGERA
jgi:RNA polymerase sigma-70 factor, ECF subfamily